MNVKKSYILSVFLSFFSAITLSQSVKGIYISTDDFTKHKLSFSDPSKKVKVKLHEFPYRPLVTVRYGDSLFTLKKDSIFGYQNTSGTCFRFFNKKIYKVINPNETILLYETTGQGESAKDMRVYTYYYFSTNSKTPIKDLTLNNFYIAFKDDPAFEDLIETHFKSDTDLLQFDSAHQMYKINRLLELSKTSHEK